MNVGDQGTDRVHGPEGSRAQGELDFDDAVELGDASKVLFDKNPQRFVDVVKGALLRRGDCVLCGAHHMRPVWIGGVAIDAVSVSSRVRQAVVHGESVQVCFDGG